MLRGAAVQFAEAAREYGAVRDSTEDKKFLTEAAFAAVLEVVGGSLLFGFIGVFAGALLAHLIFRRR